MQCGKHARRFSSPGGHLLCQWPPCWRPGPAAGAPPSRDQSEMPGAEGCLDPAGRGVIHLLSKGTHLGPACSVTVPVHCLHGQVATISSTALSPTALFWKRTTVSFFTHRYGSFELSGSLENWEREQIGASVRPRLLVLKLEFASPAPTCPAPPVCVVMPRCRLQALSAASTAACCTAFPVPLAASF